MYTDLTARGFAHDNNGSHRVKEGQLPERQSTVFRFAVWTPSPPDKTCSSEFQPFHLLHTVCKLLLAFLLREPPEQEVDEYSFVCFIASLPLVTPVAYLLICLPASSSSDLALGSPASNCHGPAANTFASPIPRRAARARKPRLGKQAADNKPRLVAGREPHKRRCVWALQ